MSEQDPALSDISPTELTELGQLESTGFRWLLHFWWGLILFSCTALVCERGIKIEWSEIHSAVFSQPIDPPPPPPGEESLP